MMRSLSGTALPSHQPRRLLAIQPPLARERIEVCVKCIRFAGDRSDVETRGRFNIYRL